MPRATILLLLALGIAQPASAQDYRRSILWRDRDAASDMFGFGDAPATAAAVARTSFDPIAPGDPGTDSVTARPVPGAQLEWEEPKQPSIIVPILGGLLGGATGAIGGTVIGAGQDTYSDDIPLGAIVGFVVGEALVLPVGVHLGNARHGSLLGDLGVSIITQVAAIGLGSVGSGAGYIVGVAGQLALTVVNERAVGRRRLRERAETSKSP